MRSATETFISNEMSVTKLGETQWTTYLINRMTFLKKIIITIPVLFVAVFSLA